MKDKMNLSKLNTEQLRDKEEELKQELFNLRFQNTQGQLTNISRIKECRRDIARVKTFIGQKQKEQR